ncbi:MAG: pilus assembly protein [Lachnospiraceae bacterium]|nr:pilus assembly protein [Lachnospiraceae bacterium]
MHNIESVKEMKKRVNGSMTVEAALIYPYLLLITVLLIQLTMYQYAVVRKQAAKLYDAVLTERETETSELIRATDMAFDLLDN